MSGLATEHLSKSYFGIRALKELSIEFEEGMCTGLIGPNGCGKTTLVNVVSGLTSISGGVVILSDRRLESVKPYRILKYGLTRTFQDGRLIAQMSVLDNLLLAMSERRLPHALFEFNTNKRRMVRARQMLKQVNLWEKKNDMAGSLSYGQRKLLEVSRAIVIGADTFLLDEPFSGLFPYAVKTICALIEDMKKKDKTVILIEHNMDLITRLCEHVVVMDTGEVLTQGLPKEVLNDSSVIEAYLGK